MAPIGQALQNGYAERLIRTIKKEEVDLPEYRDYRDAYHQIKQFLDEVDHAPTPSTDQKGTWLQDLALVSYPQFAPVAGS